MGFSLRDLVNRRFMDEVINAVVPTSRWKVLVLDKLGTRVMSSACRMSELTNAGVTVVENLDRKRQPLVTFEAIYLIHPNLDSIEKILQDFATDKPLYKGVHIFTLTPCPEELFKAFAANNIAHYILGFTELNLNFLAVESQVFSLDEPLGTWVNYSPHSGEQRLQLLNYGAEQVTTLFATLGENPYVGYCRNHTRNSEFAQAVKSRLDGLAAQGQLPRQNSGRLIIIDRSVDVLSPFIHELTYQAMLYDADDIQKDKITADGEDFILDETDDLWVKLRHMHVAEFSKEVSLLVAEYKKKDAAARPKGDNVTAQDLAQIMRTMPALKEEGRKTSFHFNNADYLMKLLDSKKLHDICEAEQDVLFEADRNQNAIKNTLGVLLPLLKSDISYESKLRLCILYVGRRCGLAEGELRQLLDLGGLKNEDRVIFRTLNYIGGQVLTRDKQHPALPRLQRNLSEKYSTSRWSPVVLDIMELTAQGSEDKIGIDYIGAKPSAPAEKAAQVQSRRKKANYAKKERDDSAGGEKIVIFVIGGMTHSEMRCAYEISQKYKQTVIIGSTNILTPKDTISELKDLNDKLDD